MDLDKAFEDYCWTEWRDREGVQCWKVKYLIKPKILHTCPGEFFLEKLAEEFVIG